MLTPTSHSDHWTRVEALVKRWLNERQTLIVLMMAINEKHAASNGHTAPPSVRIQAFCQVLMDYVSAGHFEIYDALLAEGEQAGNPALKKAQQSYPRLQRSTEAAVRFNDVYDSPQHADDLLENLPLELSELGLLLESRFELEDQLIELLHSPHQSATSPAAEVRL